MGSIFSVCCGAGWQKREPGFEQDNVDGVKFVTDKALTNEDFDDKAKLITSIKRSIGNYIRNDKEFYIGISSGSDREHAMKRRFDKYKKENNLNKMVTLFETDNQDTVRHIEDKLIHHYRENNNCLNRTGGGGGRDSEGPKYQVYIAFKE